MAINTLIFVLAVSTALSLVLSPFVPRLRAVAGVLTLSMAVLLPVVLVSAAVTGRSVEAPGSIWLIFFCLTIVGIAELVWAERSKSTP